MPEENMEELDQVRLNFSPTTLNALNIIIGLIMFGVALDLKLADFKIALSRPRAFLIGVVCQFLLLPAMAFLMAKFVAPSPSIALGMITFGLVMLIGNMAFLSPQFVRAVVGRAKS